MSEAAPRSVRLGFEHHLWQALDLLRGRLSIPAQRRRVLGLLFLAGRPPAPGGRPLPAAAVWSALSAGPAAALPARLDAALAALRAHAPGALSALPDSLGAGALPAARLAQLVAAVDALRPLLLADEGQDLLGRCYEFFLERFAEGASRGEFYTPPSVAALLVQLVGPVGATIYDPCCGSGGLLIQALAAGTAPAAPQAFGQESNPETRAIAAMGFFARGIAAELGPRAADTLAADLHAGRRFATVLANPPFNLRRWRDGVDPADPRWALGLAPASNANLAWVQHILAHLAPGGRGAVVLANGAMSSQLRAERALRSALLDAGAVEAVVSLPELLFYATPIPACVWLLRPPQDDPGSVLFLHAEGLGEPDGRAHRLLPAPVIARLAAWVGEIGRASCRERVS